MQPKKPAGNFPLFPHAHGQWAKKVKGRFYYFGTWKDDREGERAYREWLDRRDGILSGLDRLRVAETNEAMTLGQLMGLYTKDRRAAMLSGDLSPTTYGDYLRELKLMVDAVGADGQVSALKPAHFQAYADTLIKRKLGRHARRRVIALVKAMLNWGAANGHFPSPQYGTGFTAPDTSPDAMRQAKARAGQKDFSRRIVSGDEVDKLLAVASPLFRGIILLSVNCGLGPADLGRLRWRHLNLETGTLDMPRGKTGTERRGYVWKKTIRALQRVAKLKHNRKAIKSKGTEALVFLTRNGLPMYRESEIIKDGESVGVDVQNSISGTFSRLAKGQKLEGVTHYRLRHTFKTLGKRARDRDALNLMMGHREGTTGEVYDHEERLNRPESSACQGPFFDACGPA